MAWTLVTCSTATWDPDAILADWRWNGMPIGLLLALTYSHLALPDWNRETCTTAVWTATT